METGYLIKLIEEIDVQMVVEDPCTLSLDNETKSHLPEYKKYIYINSIIIYHILTKYVRFQNYR